MQAGAAGGGRAAETVLADRFGGAVRLEADAGTPAAGKPPNP